MMRARFASVLLLLLLSAAACGGDSGDPSGGTGSEVDGSVAGLGTSVPQCPFDAAKVSEVVGQPMTDQGDCLFGDGKGVASLTITRSSELAGSSTFDYQRQQADLLYDKVSDVQKGTKAYLAAKDIRGEAVLISKKGSYTIILSSFSFDVATYERTLRVLLDEIPQ